MPPPPATSIASRLVLGPALRTQSDRRLVSLVRDGYENAFEEIVRRYGRPLGRYAAAIVSSNRAEDVTQDAFSKALLALRNTDQEIELRPWLYRIVRNTALNDLRDQPPPAAPLREDIDGVETPLDAAERREEINELVRRLRALSDPQRAAIVMRELEGLSHQEIAAALGMTGGAARQTIHRARRKLRDGAGMLVPIPLLQYLLAPTAGGVAAGTGLGGGAAAGAAGAGGAGAGMALKAGVATVLVAGSVGTGVVLHDSSRDRGSASAAETPSKSQPPAAVGSSQSDSTGDPDNGLPGEERGGPGPDRHGGEREAGDDHGGRRSSGEGSGEGGSQSGPGPSSGSREGGDVSQSGSGGGGSGSPSGSRHSGSGSGTSGSGSDSGESGSDSSGGGDDVASGSGDDGTSGVGGGSPDLIPGDD